MATVKFVNLGCPKVLQDTETLAGLLKKHGHLIVEEESRAEHLVINTCSFIEDARKEAVETIFAGIQWKNSSAGRKLFVMGCLPQRYRREIADDFPEVDRFFGISDFQGILDCIGDGDGQMRRDDYPLLRHSFDIKHYRYLRIADGCDNRCAFCAIPLIRGEFRSRPIPEIVAEAQSLVADGAREIILTAQETTGYGADLPGKNNLINLLAHLEAESGAEWIRPMYLHPPKVSERLIEHIAASEKICPYFDFPIEHISDRMLRLMGRKIDRRGIEQKLRKIRRSFSEVSIRTSLLVGFPGETEEDFAELADFIEEGWFDQLGVFTYSPESGTPAFNFERPVPPEEAEFRRAIIMEIQRAVSNEKNRARIGKQYPVLVDEKTESGLFSGHSRFQSPEIDGNIFFDGPAEIGNMISAEIQSADDYDLNGLII